MSSRCATTEVTLASKLVVVTFVMEVPLAKISLLASKYLLTDTRQSVEVVSAHLCLILDNSNTPVSYLGKGVVAHKNYQYETLAVLSQIGTCDTMALITLFFCQLPVVTVRLFYPGVS